MTNVRGISKHKIHYYGGEVWFTTDRKVFNRAHKIINGEIYEDPEESCGLVCRPVFFENDIVYLVGVFDSRPDTIVHESGHLCIFILDRAGISPTENNGETLCYLLEHFFNQFSKKIYVRKKKETLSDYREGKEW